MTFLLWIMVLILAAIAEFVTTALVSVWFCVGALAAAISAALGAPMIAQVLIFAAVSAISVAATRPILRKLMPNGSYIFTNGEDDIGKTAYVVEDIDPEKGTGRVRVGDVYWSARSDDGQVIEAGTSVTILEKGASMLTVSEYGFLSL
ncbi:MAG: NfeD family protein [Oscillospiraceae bacterium]|nr:NfeD family protein [Oscillospiraceae bacterium]